MALEMEDQHTLLKDQDDDTTNKINQWSPRTSGKRSETASSGRSFLNFSVSKDTAKVLGAVVIVCLAAVLGLTVGLLIGRALHRSDSKCSSSSSTVVTPTTSSSRPNVPLYDYGSKVVMKGQTVDVTEVFASQIKVEYLQDYLYNISKQPHFASSDRNNELAVDMYNEWKTFGFDSVELLNYTVLLSLPDRGNPNTLKLIEPTGGSVLYDSHIAQEPPLTDEEDVADVLPPFNAYSANGSVRGPLVYVNYGTIDDFLYLTNGTFLSLNLTRYICIARYGNIFRGDKAVLAQKFGCKGLLIYNDPSKYAPSDTPLYPDGPSLPQFGIQRGSLLSTPGDPATPSLPSIVGMYHKPYDQLRSEGSVPGIPVQPVSYGDIVHFMAQLSDHTPPPSWTGGLNLTYRIAQSVDNNNETELTVNVHQVTRTIHNVVAKLYGKVEQDRQVIVGNHRDAWVFGTVDPGTGTAFLRTFAKAIGYLRSNADWRPGRSLVLCSWDAEEFASIGSTEWVEDFKQVLSESTVAYINADDIMTGTQHIAVTALPLLSEPLWQAARAVECPDPNFETLYDQWLARRPKDYGGVMKPAIGAIGSGSDYVSFIQTAGISSAGATYYAPDSFAVYHSLHDNFKWISDFIDPTFSHHRAASLLFTLTTLSLTTSPLLPCKANDYGMAVKEIFQSLREEYSAVLTENSVSTDELGQAVVEFANAASNYDHERERLKNSVTDSQKLMTFRVLNDKLLSVERAFIHPEGLLNRPFFKHVLYAPSSFNHYDSAAFPGITDAIFDATHNLTETGSAQKWDTVRRQIDIVRTHIRHATQVLLEPTAAFTGR